MDYIDELYNKIADLRDKLHWRRNIEELVRERLLHSSISIGDCETIFYFLNMPDDKQEFIPDYRKTEEELFRVLEMI